jgi:hypothetical protein
VIVRYTVRQWNTASDNAAVLSSCKRIHVEPSADARVRGDHCDTRDELHIHEVTFRLCFDSSDDRRIML